jgi:hypothetical protein
MIPIWRGGTLFLIACLGFHLILSPDPYLTSMHATPAQALQMHVELRAHHSLAMHFATFAGSDYETFEPIVELEQAKHAMETVAVDRQGSTKPPDVPHRDSRQAQKPFSKDTPVPGAPSWNSPAPCAAR